MRLPNDPQKYYSQFKYIELAHYVSKLNKVIREKGDFISIEGIPDYTKKYSNTGLYSSVFQYNGKHLDTSAYLGSVYFDLDADAISDAYSETSRLVNHLLTFIPEGAVRVYFSGGKGFHVECEACALGVSPSDELPGVFRYIADDLVKRLDLRSIDFHVYDARRMWRLPFSRHQRTGFFKNECMQLLQEGASIDVIQQYCEEPKPVEIPEQKFNAKANEWYREYTYRYEDSLAPKHNYEFVLDNFLNSGANSFHLADADLKFDKFNLLKNCPAVLQLQKKAQQSHYLDHYERLFLCSLLTYTDEAIQYLHEILTSCDDYQWEISNAHIQDWIHRRDKGTGGRPVTCKKAMEWGVVCSGCSNLQPHRKLIELGNGKYLESGEESSPSPVRLGYKRLKG